MTISHKGRGYFRQALGRFLNSDVEPRPAKWWMTVRETEAAVALEMLVGRITVVSFLENTFLTFGLCRPAQDKRYSGARLSWCFTTQSLVFCFTFYPYFKWKLNSCLIHPSYKSFLFNISWTLHIQQTSWHWLLVGWQLALYLFSWRLSFVNGTTRSVLCPCWYFLNIITWYIVRTEVSRARCGDTFL